MIWYNQTQTWLIAEIEAIYENLSDLTDDIELMSKAFEYATCSSKIQIFSQSRNGCQILAVSNCSALD